MRIRLFLATVFLCAASASASPLPEYPFVFTTGTAMAEVPPTLSSLAFLCLHAIQTQPKQSGQFGKAPSASYRCSSLQASKKQT
jgi:hypothetical protein